MNYDSTLGIFSANLNQNNTHELWQYTGKFRQIQSPRSSDQQKPSSNNAAGPSSRPHAQVVAVSRIITMPK